MILLDSNIVIGVFNDDVALVKWIARCRHNGETFAISTITITEALALPTMGANEIHQMIQWLPQVSIIDVDKLIALEAAVIRRTYKLTTTDAIVAATGILSNARIATRDKAFKKLKHAHVIVP